MKRAAGHFFIWMASAFLATLMGYAVVHGVFGLAAAFGAITGLGMSARVKPLAVDQLPPRLAEMIGFPEFWMMFAAVTLICAAAIYVFWGLAARFRQRRVKG